MHQDNNLSVVNKVILLISFQTKFFKLKVNLENIRLLVISIKSIID